jgi:hypothetical protein
MTMPRQTNSCLGCGKSTSTKKAILCRDCFCNGGYQHTPEARERIRLSKLGEKNPNWKGDDASKEAGNKRAIRAFSAQPCSKCGSEPADRHHKDSNPLNNAPDNVVFLCRSCHMLEEGRSRRPGKGVTWYKSRQKWHVSIDDRHIGYFNDLEAAKAARREAEIKYWGS